MSARRRIPWVVACLIAVFSPAYAHPVPFSYIDVHLAGARIDVSIVAHTFDIANDLQLQPPEKLLEPETLNARAHSIDRLLYDRLRISTDGEALVRSASSPPEAVADRQSIRVRTSYELSRTPGRVDVAAFMFPYDAQHKTFLNVYENGSVAAQAILDKDRISFQYFSGTRQGVRAVLAKFIPAGVHHILIGPDHLLFLVGLLLLGGTMRQLMLVVTAFTIAHSITLSLAALGMVMPPANAIEPAIALSIVYVGADNLLVSAGGRDTRAWIAFAFGLIHGFGFANVLREMDLPSRALGWTLLAFNVGVEIGQLVFVVLIAWLFVWIRSRSEAAGRRLVFAGSVVVMLAGAFWFVERVFFSGGAV
jgi:hydrogenase/urease accessory protein HupE